MHLCSLLILALCSLIARPMQAQTQAVQDDSLQVENGEVKKPADFVPLAVGNRWTYKHWYTEDHFYSKIVERELIIEITHTERIDGFEYFAFNRVYDSVFIPSPFWAGQKVRLTDEGVLLFRWNGQDVPVYAFPQQHNEISYTFSVEGVSDLYDHYRSSPYLNGEFKLVLFVAGYGLAGCLVYAETFDAPDAKLNEISPIKALIAGEEVFYEQTGGPTLAVPRSTGWDWDNPFSLTSVQSISWGQIKAKSR